MKEGLSKREQAAYRKSVEAQKRKYEEFLAKQEAEDRRAEADAKLGIANLKAAIASAVDSLKTTFTKKGGEESAIIILEIIDESVDTWGYTDTYEELKKWGSDFRKKIERMVTAIIDTKGAGRYNTNTFAFKKDSKGEIGRQKYKDDVTGLAKKLKVSVPSIIF